MAAIILTESTVANRLHNPTKQTILQKLVLWTGCFLTKYCQNTGVAHEMLRTKARIHLLDALQTGRASGNHPIVHPQEIAQILRAHLHIGRVLPCRNGLSIVRQHLRLQRLTDLGISQDSLESSQGLRSGNVLGLLLQRPFLFGGIIC